jgi:hypothetical protein
LRTFSNLTIAVINVLSTFLHDAADEVLIKDVYTTLSDSLIQFFKSDLVTVRRCVTICFVCFYNAFGEGCLDKLESNTKQLVINFSKML